LSAGRKPAPRFSRNATVLQEEEVNVHEYELTVVINPDIPEEEVPAAIDRVTSAVTSRGGEVVELRPWGRRRLAYSISRHTEGNYLVTQIKLDPSKARELESGFAISDDILRHLLIRKDEA
jgi:small subunit ribosomal protein S6